MTHHSRICSQGADCAWFRAILLDREASPLPRSEASASWHSAFAAWRAWRGRARGAFLHVRSPHASLTHGGRARLAAAGWISVGFCLVAPAGFMSIVRLPPVVAS